MPIFSQIAPLLTLTSALAILPLESSSEINCMRKILLYLSLILLIVLGVVVYNYAHHLTTSDLLATPTPQPWQPAQLRIPHIHVDAPIMAVGKTESGSMDAPTSQALHSPYWTSVFWYEPGVAPGQTGNAVIAGHV